jgi:hypothetical protein
MKVTAILKGKTDQYGKRKVSIRVNDGEERTFKATKIKVKPTEFEKGLVKKSHPDHKHLNTLITKAIAQTEVEVLSPDYQKKKKENKSGKVNKDFFFQWDDYIEGKRGKVTDGMITVFNNSKNALKDFEQYRKKKISFDEIDFNFYESLTNYLLFHHIHRRRKDHITGMKMSNAGKIIKQLRIFLNNRARKKIIEQIDLKDFKILDEEADAIYLTEQEISKILTCDLSQEPHLDKYRHLLVFGCRSGMRWSDFSTIDPTTDLRGNYLHKKQEKSDTWVVVPLRPDALHILVNVFKKIIPKYRQKFNDNIKKVGKRCRRRSAYHLFTQERVQDIVDQNINIEWITSHTCRRSFLHK